MFNRVDSIRIFFSFVLIAPALYGMVCSTVNAQNVSVGTKKTAEMAWVKQVGTGNTVLYSSLHEGEWSRPVQLSRENQLNLVPTLTSDNKGRTFIAWTVSTRAASFLNYVILRDGVIEAGPARIKTDMSTNMAPFLAVDLDGTPWLVWSGNNGTTSDVYYSYRENDRWLPPQRVHAKNDVPDILPELSVEPDGSVLVRWNTYGSEGNTIVTKILKGAAKSFLSPADSNWSDKDDASSPACVETLPADDIELDKATLLTRCQAESLPLQIRSPGRARVQSHRAFSSSE